MEQAATLERNRKAAAIAEANRKRSIAVLDDESSGAKRQKTEELPGIAGVLANFDFTSLPATLVTDLIVANLQVLTDQSLMTAVQVGLMKSCGYRSFYLPCPGVPANEWSGCRV